MAGLSLYCAGDVDTSALTCSTGWQAVVAQAPFDPASIDPEQVVAALSAGMFASVTVFAAVWGVRVLLNLIRKG